MAPGIQLDLTPWVRGPQTGIGRTARRSFDAVRTLLPGITGVSRSSRIPAASSSEIRVMGLLERGLGRPRTLHHAFEHRLSPLKRCTKVLSIHDLWTLREGNPYQSRRFQQVQAPILKQAISRADWITAPLPSVLAELHDRFPETRGRSSSIPWASTLNPRIEAQALPGFVPARPFVLTIAVVENRKNLVQLARAIREATHLDWLLLGKVGYGGEAALQEIRSHFPAVCHLTDVTEPQLAWAYQNAAALVLPSLEEGFGLPVLEAAQFGTPLILSRIAAFTDIIGNSGSALFFDSEGGLREILHHLKGDPQDWRLPDSRPVASRYGWEKTAALFVQTYQKLGFA